MQFITTGDRIMTEKFSVGLFYTITFTNGNYIACSCNGIGDNFVSFLCTEPTMQFILDLSTVETIGTIELYGGGAGTMNYNNLVNKPSINGFVLVGNKTAADLNLASTADLSGKQDTLTETQLTAVNSGITSTLVTQIGTNTSAISGKQDTLTETQLTAVNSGITSTLVTQIGTNKNNILTVEDSGGVKNLLPITRDSIKANNPTLNWTGYTINNCGGLTFTFNEDLSVTINGTASNSAPEIVLCPRAGGTGFLKNGTYTLDGGYSTPTELLIGVNRTVGGSGQRYAAYEGTPVTFTVSDSPNEIGVWIGVNAIGKTVTFNNVVVKPMICTSAMWGISHKYQTPTISLAELYQKLKEASVI